MKSTHCQKCNLPVETTDKFCQNCGTPIVESSEQKTKTIQSSGNYTGKMTKGKTSKGWKIFRKIIIALILIGIIALIVWFQVDPDAGKKLTELLMGIGLMAVIFFVGWLFSRGQKGKRKSWGNDRYYDEDNDNDLDGDDD